MLWDLPSQPPRLTVDVAGLEVKVQRKYYKRRPTTREEKLAQLIRDVISTSTLWYTIGAEQMNCDIVLDAIIARGEMELEDKRLKDQNNKSAWSVLNAQLAAIRAKGTNSGDWNQGELSTMLQYKMRRKGHTRFKERDEMWTQYALVVDDNSDDEP